MTTGNTINGTTQGLANGLGGGGVSGIDIGKIVNVNSTPDGVVTAILANQIAWDGIAGQAYQAPAIGSSWNKLGSVA